jgi:two-component system OmpR family sensor kinase
LLAILDYVYPLEKTELAAIYDETLILNRLISDLRELAQAEAGQLSLNLQPTDLPPLITAAADLFGELAREKQVNLTVTLPDDLPPIQADPDRLRQVLHNLLSNALRHTPKEGKIAIVVEKWQDSQVASNKVAGFALRSQTRDSTEQLSPKGGRVTGEILETIEVLPIVSGQVKVTVTDTGAGIAAEDLPHVFDRFWRANKSRAREQGGSGLGLAIARQLIEAHGGHIGVESEGVGRGSRFWFTLKLGG